METKRKRKKEEKEEKKKEKRRERWLLKWRHMDACEMWWLMGMKKNKRKGTYNVISWKFEGASQQNTHYMYMWSLLINHLYAINSRFHQLINHISTNNFFICSFIFLYLIIFSIFLNIKYVNFLFKTN